MIFFMVLVFCVREKIGRKLENSKLQCGLSGAACTKNQQSLALLACPLRSLRSRFSSRLFGKIKEVAQRARRKAGLWFLVFGLWFGF
jgi:hypothetical protein